MARAVKQIASPCRIQIEKDARNHNDLLGKTGLEEIETIRNRTRQALKVEPQVKGRVGQVPDVEAHGAQAVDDVVALVAEVVLEGHHFFLHEGGLEHGDGGFLEGHVGAAVEVGAAGADAIGLSVGGIEEMTRGTDALMNSLGPMIQATRQPGRRKRLVRPSMMRTSSSSTSMTFSCKGINTKLQVKE